MAKIKYIKFYSLLYTQTSGSDSDNIRAKTRLEQHEIYIKNAIVLNKTLRQNGIDFCLITNNKSYIEELMPKKLKGDMCITEICFEKIVPKTIRFNAAHRKIEVLKYLSSISQEYYVFLIDLDIICLRPLSNRVNSIVSNGIPIGFDISNQVFPAYGEKIILHEIEEISGSNAMIPRWYGGELIGGTPDFFKKISEEIDKIWSRYIELAPGLHHQGDEFLTSIAISRLTCKDNLQIVDAGTMQLIARHWDAKTKHVQPPLEYALQSSLLHLPNGKDFLADLLNVSKISFNSIKSLYILYRIKRRIIFPFKKISKIFKE